MEQKTIQSNSITFIDLSDSRALAIHLNANKPIVQLYNANTHEYNPAWTNADKLIIVPSLKVDAENIALTDATITWKRRNGSEDTLTTISTTLVNEQQVVDKCLQVSGNVLGSSAIITYICEASYDGLMASAEIVFNRADAGENGTGVNIVGTASAATAVSETNYYTLTYSASAVATAQVGDSYLYNGDLYVCVEAREGNDYFINAGRIKGDTGADAKYVVITGDQVFKSSNGTTYASSTGASTITLTATLYGGLQGYQWYKNDIAIPGATSSSLIINPTGTDNGQDMGIAMSAIYKCMSDIYSDTYTVVKVSDGVNGANGASASQVFLTNENVSFTGNATGEVNATTVITNVVAYTGAMKVTPQLGTITGVVSDIGMTVSATDTAIFNEIPITITIDANATLGGVGQQNGTIYIPILSPVVTTLQLNWTKINAGRNGINGTNGTDAKMVSLTANGQIFKVASNGTTVTPTTLQVRGSAQNTSITEWTYSINGNEFTDSCPSGLTQNGNVATITGTLMTASSITIKASDGTYSDIMTISKIYDGTNGNDGASGTNGADAYTVVLSNEALLIATDSTSKPLLGTPQTCNVQVYKGTTALTAVSGRAPSGGQFSVVTPDSVAGLTCTQATNGIITITPETNTAMAVTGFLSLTIYLESDACSVARMITYAASQTGTAGISATNLSLMPSSQFFKSTTGQDGIFLPNAITITPTFQQTAFSKWEYSINGGNSWTQIITTSFSTTAPYYASDTFVLTVPVEFSEYTDSVTAISFRCTATSGISDTVTLAKVYDVVDLQIGGRNLATGTNKGGNGWSWSMQTGGYIKEDYLDNDINCCQMLRNATIQTGWSIITYNAIGRQHYEPSTDYAISFKVKASLNSSFNCQLALANGESPLSESVTVVNNTAVRGTWCEMRYIIHTVSELPNATDQVLYLTGMNSSATIVYLFKDLKIERGNTFSSWMPSPEDVDDAIDNAASGLQTNIDALDSRLVDCNSSIGRTSSEILSTVSATYVTHSALDVFQSSVSSSIDQTASDIQFVFNDKITKLSNTVNENQQNIDKYIRFNDGVITLGQTNNAFSAKLSNQELGFYDGSHKVSDISNNMMHITEAEINKLELCYKNESGTVVHGYWDWIPRDNGNLSLKWRNI